MASGYSPLWRRILHKTMPFLFRLCPEFNYHWRWDRMCHCCDGVETIDLWTGKEYVNKAEYDRMLTQWHELWEKYEKPKVRKTLSEAVNEARGGSASVERTTI